MNKAFSHLTYAALTDLGRKRKNNEDAYGVFPESGVFCVADGMGGAEDGEVASQAVVEGLSALFERLNTCARPYAGEAAQAWIAQTLNDVSAWIFNRSEERGTRGTGSTFVGVCFDPAHPETAMALHAGDSRLYLLRKRLFTQITRDHSAAVLAGVKDEKELNPMFRGIVMRAVGVNETVEVERTPFGIAEGDQILLCSDGLTRMVGDKEIRKILLKAQSAEVSVRELIDLANKNGGIDNVTVLVIRVGTLPPPDRDCLELKPEGKPSGKSEHAGRMTEGGSSTQEDTGLPDKCADSIATPPTPGSGELLPFEIATPTPTPNWKTPETVPEKKEAPLPEKTKRWGAAPRAVGGVVAVLVCGYVILKQSGYVDRTVTGEQVIANHIEPASPQGETHKAEEERIAREAARKAETARLAEEKRKAEEAARAVAAEAVRKAKEARLAEEKRKADQEAARVAAAEAARKAEEERIAREAARKAEEARLAEEKRKAEDAARVAAAEAVRKAEEARVARDAARKAADEKAALDAAARKAEAEQMGSEADRQMIRLAKDRETLERFASVANSFDSEDAKRTARAVMASAQQLAPFEGRRRAAGCDAALNAFVGELANAAGFMDTYLEYEWRPRLSMLKDPQQTLDAERLIGQFEKQIKLRGGLGQLSDDAVRQKLYELVRMTSECVRQWRDIPGLVPSGH